MLTNSEPKTISCGPSVIFRLESLLIDIATNECFAPALRRTQP